MSDSPAQPNPEAKPEQPATPDKEAGKQGDAKPPRKGKWRRRLIIVLLVFFVIALALRLSIYWTLPYALSKAAGAYNLDIQFDRQHLDVIGGDVGLYNFRILPRSGGPNAEPILQADYLRGDVSTVALLSGQIRVMRAEADGVNILLERTADGRVPLLERLAEIPPSPPMQRIDFTMPVIVEAVRLSKVSARIRDAFVTPGLDTTVAMDIRLSNLGDDDSNAHFEADVWAAGMVDALHVAGEGQANGQNLDATAKVSLRGFHPKPLAVYLGAMGLKPVADTMSAELHAAVTARPIGGSTTQGAASQPAVPAKPPGTADGAITVKLVADNIKLSVDQRESALLDRLEADVAELSPTSAKVRQVLISGAKASAIRLESGNLAAAGFELVPATAMPAAPPRQPAPSPSAPAQAVQPAAPMTLALAEVIVRDVNASLRDEAVSPAVDLRLTVKELLCKARGGGDALDPEATLDLAAHVTLPGVARDVRLTGEVKPFAGTKKTAALAFRAEGVRPDILKPYLDALGVQSLLNDASVTASVRAALSPVPGESGAIVADAKLSDVTLTDGQELLKFDGVDVRKAVVAPAAIRVEAVEVAGPAFELRRRKDGSIETAGLRLGGPATAVAPAAKPVVVAAAPAAPTTSSSTTSPTSQPAFVLPRVEIGRFAWTGVKLKLTDETEGEQGTSFVIGDAGVEVADLVVDLHGEASATTAPSTKPGTLKVWLKSPELAEQFEVEGTLTPGAKSLAADLRVNGQGIDLTRIASYLKPFGIEPLLKSGALNLTVKADVSGKDNQLRGSVELSEFALSDEGKELVGLAGLSVAGVEINDEGIAVGEIDVSNPRAVVTREKDGALVAAGIRVRPTTQPAAPAEQTAFALTATQPATVPASQPAAPVAPAQAIVLKSLVVENAAVQLNDLAVSPAVHATLNANVELKEIVAGKPAPPGEFAVELSAKDIAEELALAGTVDLSPGKPAVKMTVDGKGIRGGPLASYLPPGVEMGLKDGRVHAELDAGVSENPAGGQGVRLVVGNVRYADGTAPPLLGMKSLIVDAPRIDMAGDVIAVKEVSVAGFEVGARREADGSMQLLGLVMRPADPNATPEAPAAEPAATQPVVVQPATGPTTAPSAAEAEREIARLVAAARRPLPLFTLDKLDVNATRIEYLDASSPDAKPLRVSDLRLRNVERIELGGPKAESLPPVKIELGAAAQPLAQRLTVQAQAAPFATEPAASLELVVSGITGTGITDVMPALAETLDGKELADGHFKTKLEANAKFDRRGPRDFDLSRGFQMDFTVADFAFRNGGENGPVLAGLEAVQCDALRVEPKTGRIHAKVLEITKPVAFATRDAEGIHALGLILKTPEQPATAPAEPEAEPAVEEETPEPPATAPSTAPKSEIRVDRLMISGIDVRVEDKTADPSLVVPLNNLDVEVRDLTTLALTETRPIRFSAVVGAGKVTLPKVQKGAGIAGAIGDVAGLIGGQKKEELTTDNQFEDRELFSQVTAAGNLVLYPEPLGYVKTSVSGLELAAARGFAKQSGIDISSGVFDSTVEAYFREDGSLDTRSRFILTDLSVSEPPGGPIERHLHLPAPLDVVLAALRDADGSITVPLNVPIEKGNVNTGAVVGSAAGAFAGIVASAIASAPVKIVGGVGDLVGVGALLGGKKNPAEEVPVEFVFGPGDATLSADAQRQASELITRMRKDPTVELTVRHELSSGDIAVAELRANPSPEEALALAQRLRRQKVALTESRQEMAARARAELASLGQERANLTVAGVRELDREIAAIEEASDLLWDILRPGADRQAGRRTRAAALQLAQQRLSVMREALVAADVPLAAERVRLTNATFNPTDAEGGGHAIVTVVQKKRQN